MKDLAAFRASGRPVRDERLHGYRELGLAVIRQAIVDAKGFGFRDDARAFLSGADGSLDFWATVAGLEPDRVRQQARYVRGQHPRAAVRKAARLRANDRKQPILRAQTGVSGGRISGAADVQEHADCS